MIRFPIRSWAATALVVGAAALCAISCGPTTPTPKCTTANCGGCCTAAGECFGVARQNLQTCGIGGTSCKACLPSETCEMGRCAPAVIDASVVDSGVRDAGPVVCGGGGEGCCAGGMCNAGFDCRLGRCNPCGTVGGNCCNGVSCSGAAVCQSGICYQGDAGTPVCGDAGQPCCAGSQCNPTNVCNRGFCEEQCGLSGHACCNAGGSLTCATGFACIGMRCRAIPDAGAPDAGAPKSPLGGPCNLDSDCESQFACKVLGFDRGYCTTTCATTAACPAGSQCGINPSNPGGARICFKNCSAAGQFDSVNCRTNYVCDTSAIGGTATGGVCYPACPSVTACGTAPTCDARGFCCGSVGFACCNGSMCGAGQMCMNGYCVQTNCGAQGQPCCQGGPGMPATVCNTGFVCQSGACAACGTAGLPCCAGNQCSGNTTCNTMGLCSQPVASGGVGSSCQVAANCTTGICIQTGTTGLFQGGYCTQMCSGVGAGNCPSGTFCSPYVQPNYTECYAGCQFDGGQGTCRQNYVCDRGAIPGLFTQAVCVPECTQHSQCSTGQCENGFCCGGQGFRCCPGIPCLQGGLCGNLGYCE